MEEMPDFPVFKVPVCNVLKIKVNRKMFKSRLNE
jgi:hypothetical protein